MDNKLPFSNEPRSELYKRLNGEKEKKIYPHLGFCNADRRQPLGCPLCICLRSLRSSDNF